jgi:HEAT repeat protein
MLRRNVAQLITDWNLEDPNPGKYTAVLDGMVRRAPDGPGLMEEDRLDCEPALMLQIALETDCGGPRVYAAVDALVSTNRITEAVDVLRDTPPASASTANALWRHVATPARLRLELSAPQLDFATIDSLVGHLGALAIDPLLDLLEQASDRSVRARTLRVLVAIGPPVAPVAAARLKDAPWFVQRNLLALLRMLKVWPAGFSAVTYARHPDIRLRREAFKLLLEFPEHRASAIMHGLGDENPEIVTLVLRAAVDGCPPEALRSLERFLADRRRPAELRAIAVLAVGRANGPNTLAQLLDLAGTPRHFFGWRIEAKSPVVLAAVSVLARNWGGHPQVLSLLREARDHDDPEIRHAAQVRFA